MLPESILELISRFSVVGFSGSRSCVSGALYLAVEAVSSQQVLVGCTKGVDAAVRELRPDARVFDARVFGAGRGAFAARSVRFVDALYEAEGLLLSFPSGPCPVGVFPSASSSRAFCGGGSGSWATLAYAVGRGVRSAVFLPTSVSLPGGWGLQMAGPGWFVSQPAPVQASLFA